MVVAKERGRQCEGKMNDVYRTTIVNPNRSPLPISQEELERLYMENELSMTEIGK